MVNSLFNPFTWDVSGSHVTSNVVSLEVKDDKGQEIRIEELKSDIEISIAITSSPKATEPVKSFVKPNEMQYRPVNVKFPGSTLQLDLQVKSQTVQVFVRYGVRPTADQFDYSTRVPDLSRCTKISENYNCPTESYNVNIPGEVFNKTGVYVIGLLYTKGNPEEISRSHSRRKRSCGDHGRQKRSGSCVEIKDPPTTSPPRNVTIFPSYNKHTDVNFTISVAQANCLYWNKQKQKWTSEGCKVRMYTVSNFLSHITF